MAIVGAPPVITVQPTNQTVSLGGSTTFTVTVTSSSALTYQWYFNGVKIAGATTNTCTCANVQFTNAGPYYVAITNSAGSINSTNAILNVTPASTNTLASPWATADIGSVGLVGSAFNVSNLYTVNGAGSNVSGATVDAFRYVYQTMPGNGSIIARINSHRLGSVLDLSSPLWCPALGGLSRGRLRQPAISARNRTIARKTGGGSSLIWHRG